MRALFISLVWTFCLVVWPQAASGAKSTSTIIMLTWRGETAAETAFIDTLKASGRDIELIRFDAGRDRSALARFLRENAATLRSADGIYTFGTLSARVVQNLGLEDVPHVFNIVADPVGSGLVKTLAEPGVPRTGAKLTAPMASVLPLISQAIRFKDAAIIFDPRERTSEAQYNEASILIEAQGMPVKGVRFVPDADNADRQTGILRAQLADVDLVYVPAASSLVTHMATIAEAAPEEAVIVGAVEAHLRNGATLVVGTDFAERGRVSARMMLAILEGADPAKIPVNEVPLDQARIFVNIGDPRSERINLEVLPGDVVLYGEPFSSGLTLDR